MHRRITGLADTSGRPQVPWPRKFGTPPWAVARQLSATPAADGSTTAYAWHVARTSLPSAYERLLDSTAAGRVAAIFIGSTWLPRPGCGPRRRGAVGSLCRSTTPPVDGSAPLTASRSLDSHIDIAGLGRRLDGGHD